jgi:hypothetical protein
MSQAKTAAPGITEQERERLRRFRDRYVMQADSGLKSDAAKRLDFLRWLRERGRLES